MSWIAASDPLALLALQTVVGSPATEGAAVGTSQLDRPQTAAVLGEPVGSTVLAALLLDEAPGVGTLAGCALVLAGVGISLKAR